MHQEINAQSYDAVIISADNLAGVEKIDIFMDVNGSWEIALDNAGVVAKLTATRYQWGLPGGCRYGVLKDDTVGACAVTVNVRQEGAP